MKLFHLSQSVKSHYDTYDSAVVAAENEEAARRIHPDGNRTQGDLGYNRWSEATNSWQFKYDKPTGWKDEPSSSWALPSEVTVTLIGEAVAGTQSGCICASFNAG